MASPLVSILIPAYNVEPYLKECLESLVNQTHKILQIVIVDDGSTDQTGKICDEYAAKYPFVEVYHIPNGGVANARNVLLSKSKGEYVLFVDSDDWVELEMAEKLVNIAEEEQADMVTCSFSHDNGAEEPQEKQVVGKQTLIKEFLRHKVITGSLWNKLIKKDIVDSLIFNPNIHYGEDALFIWQAIQKVNKIVFTRYPLYHYRHNPQSISHTTWSPDKKGTGHLVWEEICKDVARDYPNYLEIAQARFGLEDMWALFFASASNYPKDQEIDLRQRNIKELMPAIRKFNFDGKSKTYVAWLLSKWYGAGNIINWLYSLKKK